MPTYPAVSVTRPASVPATVGEGHQIAVASNAAANTVKVIAVPNRGRVGNRGRYPGAP